MPALEDRALADLFAGLADEPSLLLAVSGGPDSMALMHLAARWAEDLGTPPRLHVATVDHGLREQSGRETALVASAAAALGLGCRVLAWTGPKPATRIQERAREARYSLLATEARAVGAPVILTAHHADDQAETVLLRLTRGSGPSGLAAMRRETSLAGGVRLVRPLLAVPKAALIATCVQHSLDTVEDPSNRDPAYARSRVRASAARLARVGLDRDTLTRLAARMARMEDALEAETERREAEIAPQRAPGRYAARLAPIGDIAPEILLRLLRRAIWHAADPSRLIRLDRLERLTATVLAAREAEHGLRATLGGARIDLDADGRLLVTCEPTRNRGRRARRDDIGAS